MRGKAGLSTTTTASPGITPAYAGKRIRSNSITHTQGGSPPRMRGKVPGRAHTPACPGITPAYAGKSVRMLHGTSLRRDHPRVCGEKYDTISLLIFQAGSPPRMRGKGVDPCVTPLRNGITPAYAGKRRPDTTAGLQRRDHPRVCGEKFETPLSCNPVWGSPPRMRGKEKCQTKNPKPTGITPAYAGKSKLTHSILREGRDHPRVCGEKCPHKRRCPYRLGSPPRMRGKVTQEDYTQLVGRITPAYAGKRPSTGRASARTRDHPRVCGEKGTVTPVKAGPRGSPPRMRGKDFEGIEI